MSCSVIKDIRDGTSQLDRLPIGLAKDYLEIDNRTLIDMYRFALEYSQQINYYNSNNQLNGDWKNFFPDEDSFVNMLYDPTKKRQIEGHLALLVAFFELLGHFKEKINAFAFKHLDYVYQDVLKFKLNTPKPDKAHVITILHKTVKDFKIPAGTLFDAGKNIDKQRQVYKSLNETIINHSEIGDLKQIFVDREDSYKIYASAFANLLDGLNKPLESEDQSWHIFGTNQQNLPAYQRMPLAKVGFAIASPMFYLSEGERNITITFKGNFPEAPPDVLLLKNSLAFYMSGEKDWVTPNGVNIVISTDVQGVTTLSILLNFLSDQASIVNYDNTVLKDGFKSTQPLLKVLFLFKENNLSYQSFSNFSISSCKITVDVKGLRKFNLVNDTGMIDGDKPFYMFGASPKQGATFYIGNPEVFGKSIDSLDLFIEYQEAPISFADYYSAYFYDFSQPTPSHPPNIGIENESFQASARILSKGIWEKIGEDVNDTFQLFDSVDAQRLYSLRIIENPFPEDRTVTINKTMNFLERVKQINSLQNSPPRSLFGYLAIDFIETRNSIANVNFTNFGHNQYSSVYTNVALGKANPATAPDFLNIPFPNAPYSPLVKTISLNYSSSIELSVNQSWEVEEFFHILPFGHKAIDWIKQGNKFLLSQFEEEGCLFIGLKNFYPPNNINLLFQLEDGSGDESISLRREDIAWSYLSEDEWIIMDDLSVVTEQTEGFQTSGIVTLSIGANATKNNHSLPKGLHWIKVSAKNNSAGASKSIGIHAQAILVEYIPDDAVPEKQNKVESLPSNAHLIEPNTIKKLIYPLTEIKSVQQPYSSFGGQGREDYRRFLSRVSERLRHKNRAISLWDYERLILDRFPSLYKVKCLKHYHDDQEYSPGNVTIVVLPNLRNVIARNSLEPKTSKIKKSEIQNYISLFSGIQPFVSIVDPIYERILLDFKVGFQRGKDAGFYGKKLNEDIKKYLSPWAFEEGRDVIFGSTVSKSDIIAHIEKLDYVDFITDFFMYHNSLNEPICPGLGEMILEVDFIVREIEGIGLGDMAMEDTFVIGEPANIATASSLRSIITSAPNHRIRVLSGEQASCRLLPGEGLGIMAVEVDFTVHNN